MHPGYTWNIFKLLSPWCTPTDSDLIKNAAKKIQRWNLHTCLLGVVSLPPAAEAHLIPPTALPQIRHAGLWSSFA